MKQTSNTMNIEWQQIKTDKQFNYNRYDYLYLHNSKEFPLQNEVSLYMMYLIVKKDTDKLKVMRMSDGEEKEIQYSELISGFWYCLVLNPNVRKAIEIPIN